MEVESRRRDGSTERPRSVGYHPAQAGLPLECFALAELVDRVRPADLGDLEQLQFDLVIACTGGSGVHEVDFEAVTVDRHRWLHIRPGQVHRWVDLDYEAVLILCEPRPAPSPHWRSGPRLLELDADQLHDVEPVLALLRHRRHHPLAHRTLASLRDLVVAWLGLDRLDDEETDPLYLELRRLLDTEAVVARTVEHYARRLNCSPRTLARACERAGAPAPKRLIDEAALLHAQRMLALPGATVTATAAALGFAEPTNFTKFFKRVEGRSPTEWLDDRRR